MALIERNNNNYNFDLLSIPVLRYLKPPVDALSELYAKYPEGGERGWFAFVVKAKKFAYWDNEAKQWNYVGSGSETGGSGGGNSTSFGGAVIHSLEELDTCGEPNVYPVNLPAEHPIICNNHFALLVMRGDNNDNIVQVAFSYIGGNNLYGVFMRSGEAGSNWGAWKQINGEPPAPSFQIRKRRGIITVIGNPTVADMTGIKLCVFKKQRGTIGRFFIHNGNISPNIPNYFLNRELAATARFEFDMNLINGVWQFKLGRDTYGGVFVDNSLIEKEFIKIVKVDQYGFVDNNGYFYIGSNRGPTVRGKFPFAVEGSIQATRYYSLFVALTKGNKVVSNYVRIFAFHNGWYPPSLGGLPTVPAFRAENIYVR
ncbi:MAG: pyocin knob domain-containing protein [Paludibacter sp.]|nr:pyocin knob domain-containing protein [Paludibacter sp.]